MLRHVVMFSFKEGTPESDILKLDESFKKLPLYISEIMSFESGVNISPENLNKGYTHIYSLAFADEKDRDVYLYHEAHKAFSKEAERIFDDVLVVDYRV